MFSVNIGSRDWTAECTSVVRHRDILAGVHVRNAAADVSQ